MFFDLKPHRDLTQTTPHRHYFVQLRMEIVLQHRGPRMFEVEIGVTPDLAATGLIRNRPSVKPSQYPLTEYPASSSGSRRACTR